MAWTCLGSCITSFDGWNDRTADVLARRWRQSPTWWKEISLELDKGHGITAWSIHSITYASCSTGNSCRLSPLSSNHATKLCGLKSIDSRALATTKILHLCAYRVELLERHCCQRYDDSKDDSVKGAHIQEHEGMFLGATRIQPRINKQPRGTRCGLWGSRQIQQSMVVSTHLHVMVSRGMYAHDEMWATEMLYPHCSQRSSS